MFLLRIIKSSLIVWVCVGVIVFPACVQKKTSYAPADEKIEQLHKEPLNEARLVDMPFPIGIAAYNITTQGSDVLVATYQTSFSGQFLYGFYQREMERLGWQESLHGTSAQQEFLLVYRKPYKICVIDIQKDVSGTQVNLWYGEPLDSRQKWQQKISKN